MTLRLCRPLVNYFDENDLQTDCICALLQTHMACAGNSWKATFHLDGIFQRLNGRNLSVNSRWSSTGRFVRTPVRAHAGFPFHPSKCHS
jgi:hypothetical protein